MTPSRRSGRVLVAEDDELVRRACVRLLTAAGHTVEAVADGAAAAALLDTQLDVVISDVNMPGIDGMALLRAVRQRDLDLPVILMTGTPSIASASEAVANGALRYLVKPFVPGQLTALVEQAIGLYELALLKRQALELVGPARLSADRAGLGVKLDSALEQMWMAYQPIVSCETRRVFAFEALMRSDEPDLPHPGAILDAAERTGRLRDVGRRVRQLVAQRVPEAGDALTFVNLHTLDLLDDQLYAADAPLSAHSERVVLEITERAALDDVADISARIGELRRLGYRIAVDDLGAGYAGLTSLVQLEPEVVKLDMSLVRDVDRQPTRQALVRSLLAVCRDLNIPVVAEGVETPGERDVLVAAGADLLQGYLFGRPQRELVHPKL